MHRLILILTVLLAGAASTGEPKQKKELPEDTVKPTVADEAYGKDPANVFDLWLPATEQAVPLLIYIHGGGFRAGSKELSSIYTRDVRDMCLRNGIAFASMEYRLSQVSKYPAQMHDCARGLQYIRHHAGKWKLDPKRVACMGASAGAGITMWLGFHADLADPEAEDPIERQSTRLVCLLPRNGQCTYDPREIKQIIPGDAFNHPALKPWHGLKESFNWEKDEIDAALDAALKDCSALTHLTKDDPPVYQLHYKPNEKDGDIHHPNFGRHLEAGMKKLGLDCTSRIDHSGWRGYYPEALKFMKKHFGME